MHNKFEIKNNKNIISAHSNGFINPIIFRRVLEIGNLVSAEWDVYRVLTMVIDTIVEILGAEYGLVILFDEKSEFLFEIIRNSKKESINKASVKIKLDLIDEVRSKGESIIYSKGIGNRIIKKDEDDKRLNTGSVLCLPLKYRGRIIGVVYIDNKTQNFLFRQDLMFLFELLTVFITPLAHRALERDVNNGQMNALEKELRKNYQFEYIIGHHPSIIEVLKIVAQVADTDATVLIQGESGTGKEIIAHALHFNSSRKPNPFVTINCGAIPENLLESELFGHVRGAFTGAIKDKQGWFECANAGTIFLDEVSEMSQALQVKFLRVLQTGEYNWVGSTEIHHCNVRIIAATSKDLKELIKVGKFRDDLYYRLNVIEINLPPMRERRSDIPHLTKHFLKKFGVKYNKENLRLSREAEASLLSYNFHGNVRELENIVERAVILAMGEFINPQHFPVYVYENNTNNKKKEKKSNFKITKQQLVEKFEKEYIVDCLRAANGNISIAAQTAGLHVTNFYLKMKKYGIISYLFKLDKEKS